MEKIEFIKIVADSFLEVSIELHDSGKKIVSSTLAYFAYLFYRDIEDVKGMQDCYKYTRKEDWKNPIDFGITQKMNFGSFKKIGNLEKDVIKINFKYLIQRDLGGIE